MSIHGHPTGAPSFNRTCGFPEQYVANNILNSGLLESSEGLGVFGNEGSPSEHSWKPPLNEAAFSEERCPMGILRGGTGGVRKAIAGDSAMNSRRCTA